MSRPTMTSADMDQLANEVREVLVARCCCPGHASAVAMRMLASFALDDADNNQHKAAATIRRVSTALATDVERGVYTFVRTTGGMQ